MVPEVLVINYRASFVQKLMSTLDIYTLGVHVHIKYQVFQISSQLELFVLHKCNFQSAQISQSLILQPTLAYQYHPASLQVASLL